MISAKQVLNIFSRVYVCVCVYAQKQSIFLAVN